MTSMHLTVWALFLGLFSAACRSTAPTTPPADAFVFVYLKTGPAAATTPAEERTRLQAEHLANIGRLAENGQLLVAGPFGKGNHDPRARGIFVFDVATAAEARRLTETDPSVRAGVLELEAHPLRATPALREMPRLAREQREETIRAGRVPQITDGIRQYQLVLVKDMGVAEPAFADLARQGKIAWSGRFGADLDGWGVFVVDAKDPSEVTTLLGAKAAALGEFWIDPWWSSALLMRLGEHAAP